MCVCVCVCVVAETKKTITQKLPIILFLFYFMIFKKPNQVNLEYPKSKFISKKPQESRFVFQI